MSCRFNTGEEALDSKGDGRHLSYAVKTEDRAEGTAVDEVCGKDSQRIEQKVLL